MAEDNVISAFSAEHVMRVTGLSKGQLSYWDKTKFFKPRHASENRREPYSRIYSFQDVVGLRTLSVLRKEYKIPLQHLRSVAKELSQYTEAPWSELTLYVLGREVQFKEPATGMLRGVTSQQYVNIPLRSIIEDVAEKAKKLKERTQEQLGQVVRHRLTAHNAWVVAGTRIPIASIRRFNEAGYKPEEIIREYPVLTKKDVRAALNHKAKAA